MDAIAELQHPKEGEIATVSYEWSDGKFFVSFYPTPTTVERLPQPYDTIDEMVDAAHAFAAERGLTVYTRAEFHRQFADTMNFIKNEHMYLHD